jgi:hypothetical protein
VVTFDVSQELYNVSASDFDAGAEAGFKESVANATDGVAAGDITVTGVSRRRLRSSSTGADVSLQAISSLTVSYEIKLVMEQLGYTSVQDLVDAVDTSLAKVDFADPQFAAAF